MDLGGTQVKMALIQDGTIQETAIIPSFSAKGLKPLLPVLANYINNLLDLYNLQADDLDGIGASMPGIIDSKNMKMLTVYDKYEDANQVNLVQWARDNWDVPLVLENDARCALIGEWKYGKGQGYDNVAIMTLGTGIGTSAVIDGKVLRGKHFMAGVLGGHFILDWDGLRCNCGNKGCAEALSASWNLKTICRQFPEYPGSELEKAGEPDFKRIFDRAEQGDSLAARIRDHCMEVWVHAMVNLVYAYDPEIIILSGGVLASRDIIIPYIKKRLHTFGWAPFQDIKIEVSDHFESSGLLSAEHLIKSFTGKA
jgi:glucokinase